MAARSDDMATIEAALTSNHEAAPPADQGKNSDVEIAPGVRAPSLVENQQERDETNQQQDLENQSERQRLIENALIERQKDEDAFEQSASRLINSMSRIARGTGARLGRIPTPGSLMLPLGLLLLFFFLLLPVNGHTRLSWLWLVLTGGAQISGSGSGSGSNGSDTGGFGSAAAQSLAGPPAPPPIILPVGPGAPLSSVPHIFFSSEESL